MFWLKPLKPLKQPSARVIYASETIVGVNYIREGTPPAWPVEPFPRRLAQSVVYLQHRLGFYAHKAKVIVPNSVTQTKRLAVEFSSQRASRADPTTQVRSQSMHVGAVR